MTQTKQIVGVYLCGKNYVKQPARHMAVSVPDKMARLSDSEEFRQNVIETCCREMGDYLKQEESDPQ